MKTQNPIVRERRKQLRLAKLMATAERAIQERRQILHKIVYGPKGR